MESVGSQKVRKLKHVSVTGVGRGKLEIRAGYVIPGQKNCNNLDAKFLDLTDPV